MNSRLDDAGLKGRLIDILKTLFNKGTKSLTSKPSLQQENAYKAILFEAIKVTLKLNLQLELVQDAANLLSTFIHSPDTNTRYLALETLSSLRQSSTLEYMMQTHQDSIIQCLKDKDISIRQRALDLLYNSCTADSAKFVVRELLRFMSAAEFSLQDELMLRIAILAEKYATELSWYFEVILQLIQNASPEALTQEVWFRAVQVVVNHPELPLLVD